MSGRAGGRWIQIAMVGAVIAVFLLAYLDLRREQARALDDFAGEQAALGRASAATLGARVDGVVRDLDAAADAAAGGRADAALRRLVGAGELYRELDVLDERGAAAVEITAPGAPPLANSPSLRAARAQLLGAATSAAPLAISGPLRRDDAPSGERLRLFIVRRGDRAVCALVNTARFFDGMQVAGDAVPTRWIVIDDALRRLELGGGEGGGEMRWSTDERVESEAVARLLERMRAGESGALLLDRAAAASLGLERRSAIAGFAPVAIRGARPWSVAVVVSAMRVRDRARLAAWRLGAATGLASVIVALFGILVTRQQRRSQALSEALKIAEATSALRERAEKIVETIPIGVLALTDAGNALRVTSVNPYLSDRGVHTGPLGEALAEATREELGALEQLVLEARNTRRPAQRLGFRLRLGGAEPRDVDAYAIPLGRPLADAECFLVLHDRTEMRVLERSLQRVEKLATIGTLAAGVAHEVGTPLGIISGRAEQLLARLPDGDEAARKSLDSILAQVDKVSTTIRQLLDFSRTRPIETAAVTPAQALGSAAALLEHRFRHAKVALAVDAPLTVAAVAADVGQLEQVLVNLLMNACDACAAGGHVTARALAHPEQGDRVAIEITDDGSGIAAEHLPHVLDPFFTTKKRGQGTGLGLTIAADIVKNHGGTFEIDSAVGRGTTVRIVLPIAKETHE
ncbi:MAG TPA: ATP-binding protein [Polyangia bacterium]|nr:ATP-binding protein [Polyangia bacterium]